MRRVGGGGSFGDRIGIVGIVVVRLGLFRDQQILDQQATRPHGHFVIVILRVEPSEDSASLAQKTS